MSLFDKDLITSKTQLHEFYDRIKDVIQVNFERIYMIYKCKNYSLDLSLRYTAATLNHEILKFQKDFAEFGMYYPRLHCIPITDSIKSKILISVIYSEDPYMYDKQKEFLHISLPLSNITTDSYESIR